MINSNPSKKLYGWSGTILTVDLTERKILKTPTKAYAARFLGGIGIGQKIYWDTNVDNVHAFHPDSPLILMTGPLAGTLAPSAPRLVVCGKSPSMYPESFNHGSLGGFFAAELKSAGFDGIVIRGKASLPLYLSINSGTVELKDAGHLWGLTNSKTRKMLRAAFGEKIKSLTIGPGAENGSRIGTIASDAGSSVSKGFGSVMGSKNLKAIVVSGTGTIPVADQEKLNRVRKQIKAMTGEGYYNIYEKPVTLPGIEVVKKIHCHGCPGGCWRTLNRIPAGKEGIRKCQNAMFYLLWSSKFQQTANEISFRATSLVEDYSLCVLEVSFILMWLEKCFELNVLSEKDIQLSHHSMGSWEFLEAFVKKLSYNEGFGRILAEGVARAAEHMGKNAKIIADTILPMPYAPKVLINSTLLYATERQPPIVELHEAYRPLAKWALWYKSNGSGSYFSTDVLRRIAKKFWGSEIAADFSTCSGKALAAVKIQNRQYVKESLVLCDFVYPVFDNASSEDHAGDPALESRLLSAVTGKELDGSSLDRIGERIFNLKRAILMREGRKGKEDDILPESQYIEGDEERFGDGFSRSNPDLFLPGAGDEIISRKGKALKKEEFEHMRDKYYKLRNWDNHTGLQKKRELQRLNLSEVIEPLKEKVI